MPQCVRMLSRSSLTLTWPISWNSLFTSRWLWARMARIVVVGYFRRKKEFLGTNTPRVSLSNAGNCASCCRRMTKKNNSPGLLRHGPMMTSADGTKPSFSGRPNRTTVHRQCAHHYAHHTLESNKTLCKTSSMTTHITMTSIANHQLLEYLFKSLFR